MPIRESAPAKLNLYLHVVGRRPDGYHLLDSLVAFADVADEIVAVPADALSLEITGPFAAALEAGKAQNLVWRAATLLARHLGRAPDAAITLAKNLPVASGIGGGSSDAAATLRALAALWDARLGAAELATLGAALGADVPVCLAARTSWLSGIGEHVEAGPALPPVAVVLTNPGVALPTASVFRRRTGAFSQAARFAGTPRSAIELVALLARTRNDLTAAAIALVPAIGEALDALAAANGALIARMSGSGATCFALFASDEQASAAAEILRARHAGWWVAAGRLVP